jgi:hypothetical protein
MGVGPEGRTGRAQLVAVRAGLIPALGSAQPGIPIVVVHCAQAPASLVRALAAEGAHPHEVTCAGNLHSSVVELIVRRTGGGVLIGACPPRDCLGREGPKWLEARLFHEREAELQERVDRRRVRVTTFTHGLDGDALRAFAEFARDLAALEAPVVEPDVEPDAICVPVPIEEGVA